MEPSDAIADVLLPREGAFRIELPAFEGPLDLLLHLIRKHELDVLDLPVAFVTERYLEYMKLMQDLDLDIASEYLLMAATLAHIKSKMLLPRTPAEQQDDGDLGEMLDPRADLIRRLLEYQKYKAAAEHLGGRNVAGRDVFFRGADPPASDTPAPLAEIGMFRLLDAFEAILDRAQDRRALEVTSEQITIQERMTQIADLLRERKQCLFEELFATDVTRFEIVITFLALLEMTKMHLTRIYQSGPEAPIHVQFALLDPSLPSVPPPAAQADTASSPAIDELDALEQLEASYESIESQEQEDLYAEPREAEDPSAP